VRRKSYGGGGGGIGGDNTCPRALKRIVLKRGVRGEGIGKKAKPEVGGAIGNLVALGLAELGVPSQGGKGEDYGWGKWEGSSTKKGDELGREARVHQQGMSQWGGERRFNSLRRGGTLEWKINMDAKVSERRERARKDQETRQA